MAQDPQRRTSPRALCAIGLVVLAACGGGDDGGNSLCTGEGYRGAGLELRLTYGTLEDPTFEGVSFSE